MSYRACPCGLWHREGVECPTAGQPAALGEDPAVLTWRIALAPRPQYRVGRHWWRELVTDAWRSADHAWWLEREQVAMGYSTEMREFEQHRPRPKLRDFMRHLSHGQLAPESIGGLM